MALVILVANARYLLMSFAMSQRLSPNLSLFHRICMGFDITDELFAIAMSRPGYLNPFYTYGAVLTAAPCWAIGTALGIAAGNIMPLRAVSALSVALYGMFLFRYYLRHYLYLQFRYCCFRIRQAFRRKERSPDILRIFSIVSYAILLFPSG